MRYRIRRNLEAKRATRAKMHEVGKKIDKK